MIGKVIWKLSSPFRGKVSMAKYWEKLYQLSCAGLNLGQGENVATSGEGVVLRRVKAAAAEPIVFDVGANIGNYSKMATVELGEVEIHCFEPSISTYTSLCNNLQDYNKIYLNNFGLSKELGEASLYYDFKGSGIASLYNRQLDYHGIKFESNEVVKLDTLDNYCEKRKINKIDLLKIDVEGNEFNVLLGARKMLEDRKIKTIQFEFGGTDIDARIFIRDFWNLLHEHYKIYRIMKDGLVEIEKYNEYVENFLCTNYFCELK